MIINHNLSAMNAHRQMGINNGDKSKSIEKLSSGMRINRAGDDAAGLSISEKMRGQIRGLNQASRNSQDGISLIQTAEGALSETQSIIQRMRQLAVQSANGTNQNEDRDKIAKEFEELQSEITRIGNDTEFNKMKLINGDLSSEEATTATDLGVFNTYSVGSLRTMKNNAQGSVTTIKGSIATKKASIASKQASIAGKKASIEYINSVGIAKVNSNIKGVNNKLTKLSDRIKELSNAIKNSGLTESMKKTNMDSIAALQGSIEGTVTGSLATYEGSIKSWEESINNLQGSVTTLQGSATTLQGSAAEITKKFDKKNASVKKLTQAVSVKEAGLEMPAAVKGQEVKFQVGANSGQVIELQIGDMRATALGVNKDAININTQSASSNAITVLDEALTKISDQRAKLGAAQNRLEHTITSTDNTSENLQSAESRIRDVDMAEEMMNYTKSNILTSAAQSMLAQANQAPNNVLQLLQ